MAKGLGPTITDWGVLHSNPRTVFAKWAWTNIYTDHYELRWEYATGDGHWWRNYDGTDYETTKNTHSQYTPPDGAVKVRFSMRPIAKKHKVKKKDTPYSSYTWYPNSS